MVAHITGSSTTYHSTSLGLCRCVQLIAIPISILQIVRERLDTLSGATKVLGEARQAHSERMDTLERRAQVNETSTNTRLHELDALAKRESAASRLQHLLCCSCMQLLQVAASGFMWEVYLRVLEASGGG